MSIPPDPGHTREEASRRPARRARPALMGAALVVIGLGVAAYVYAGRAAAAWLHPLVIERLEQATGGEAKLGTLHVSFLRREVVLEQLSIEGGDRWIRSLRAERAQAAVFARDLVQGRLRLRSVAVDRLGLRLESPAEESSEDSEFDFSILSRLSRVRVREGRIALHETSLEFDLDVDELQVQTAPARGASRGGLQTGRVWLAVRGVSEWSFERVAARLNWTPPRLAFDEIDARGADVTFGGSLNVGLVSSGLVATGELEAEFEAEQLGGLLPGEPSGRVRAHGRLRYADGDRWLVETRFDGGPSLSWSGLSLDRIDARMTLSPGRVLVSELKARGRNGWTVDDGIIDWQRGDWNARLAASLSGSDLIGALGLESTAASGLLSARATLRLEARGIGGAGLTDWTLSGGLTPDEAAVGGVPLRGELAAQGRATSGSLRLTGRCGASAIDLGVETRGAWPEPEWTAQVRLTAPTAEALGEWRDQAAALAREVWGPLSSGLPSGESASASAVLRGRGRQLREGTIEAQLAAPDVAGLRFDRFEVLARVRHGRIDSVSGRLAQDDGRGLLLRAAASEGPGWRVSVRAEAFPLSAVRALAERHAGVDWLSGTDDGLATELVGQLDAQVDLEQQLTGLHGHWLVHGSGNVGAWPGQLISVGSWRGSDFRVPLVLLRAPGLEAQFEGRGSLPSLTEPGAIDGMLTASTHIERFPLAWSVALGSGTVRLHAALSGPLAGWSSEHRPEWAEQLLASSRGEIRWRDLIAAGAPVPDGVATFGPAADGAWSFEARAGAMKLHGQLVDRASRVAAELRWSDLELVPMAEQILGRRSPLSLSLRTDGRLSFEGAWSAPREWTGSGSLMRLDIEGPTFFAGLRDPVGLRLSRDGLLEIERDRPAELAGERGSLLRITGGVGLAGDGAGTLQLVGDGSWDLRLLEAFAPELIIDGRVEGQFEIGGTTSDPQFGGELRVSDGFARSLAFDDGLDRLSGRLRLEGHDVTIQEARCRLGGGRVDASGKVSLEGWTPQRVDIALTARDVALNEPEGIWGRYDGDLKVEGALSGLEISGELRMLAGRYTQPFGIGGLIGDRVRLLDPSYGLSSWLYRTGVRVRLVADDSLAIRNDLARLESSLRLDVSGTLGRPLLAGTIVLAQGGRLSFRGQDYEVVSGQVILDDVHAEPVRLRLRAFTELRGYRIQLDLDASSSSLDYRLASVPALSQEEILALLITGQTLDEMGGRGGLLRPDFATAYFGTQLGELLLAEPVRRLFGITTLQLAPTVVGPESRPTARLTVGSRIDERTSVLYSRDLSAEARDVYRIERDLGRAFRLALGSESDAVAVDLRWFNRFGRRRTMGAEIDDGSSVAIREASITGLPQDLDPPSLRRLGLGSGQPAHRARLLAASESLRQSLAEQGFLEADIEIETKTMVKGANVRLRVDPGPRWEIAFDGPPRSVRRAREQLSALWAATDFRPERLREAERVLEDALADEGYAAAFVEVRQPDPARRHLSVSLDPGPRVFVEEVSFEGLEALPVKDVSAQVLSRPRAGWAPGGRTLYRPKLVGEDLAAIRTLYESRGYLEADVTSRVRFRGDGEAVVLTFVIEEGRRFDLGQVRVEGDWPEELGPATQRVLLTPGAAFLTADLERALQRLATDLDQAGYYTAAVVIRPEIRESVVDVTFGVQPGPKAMIESIQIEGLARTREKLVARRLQIEPGQPLSQRALRATERELFQLGLFRGIEIVHEPLVSDPERHIVMIQLEEISPLSLLTSLGYDTEEKVRVSASLSHDNLAGLGRTGALQGFVSDRRRGARITLEDPYVRRARYEALLSLGIEEETRDGFTVTSPGIAVQLATRTDRSRRWELRYQLDDNRFKDVTLSAEVLEDVLLTERGRLDPIQLGSLSASWILDRRDDIFLPTQGWMGLSELGWWSDTLASEADFMRWSGQLAGYRRLGERWTLGGSLRVAAAAPRRDTRRVPLAERLFAGGADTLRGFERDRLGPTDGPGGEPLGGEGLLLLNVDLRRRLWENFELVLFHDRGNVWLDADQLSLDDLRETLGLSLRWRTPVGALRIGYGWKLDRLEGESGGEFFLSIGEPF
ncbi:MAG: translocation/assembly module TamB domain-containing protein [Acidobacteriota bacterium]|nr:MAG: translocation/assembly module TamB domain-containing protein [Acidobacteriota bacterium]